VRSLSGKASTMTCAEHLSRLAPAAPEDGTSLSAAIRRLADMNLRRGLLVIISDFFDPQGLDAVRDALRAVRHRVLFVQLTRPSDASPDLDGDVRLRDCETGEVTELTVTPDVRERYREAYARFSADLAAIAKYYRGGLLQVDVERDLITQLNAFFAEGKLTA